MKVKCTLKNGEIRIYEYDHRKYYNSEKIKSRQIPKKMSPEEGVKYYSDLYPDEKISYDPDIRVFVSESGRYFSRSKKRGEIAERNFNHKPYFKKLSPEEGIEYYSSLYPGEEIRYNKEYDVFVSDQGNIFSRHKGRGKHKLNHDIHGYVGVKGTTVHKVVMKTFGKYIEGMDVDHINGIRDDNRLCNLQMLSHSDNIKKRERSSDKAVKCIELNKTFKSLVDAAKEFGLTSSSLSMHLNGRSKTFGGYHWEYVQ